MSLLHENLASNATVQQQPQNSATGYAASTQHTDAKPASLLDIARNKLRNKLRNNHATSTESTTQQAPIIEGDKSSLLQVAFTSNATTQQAQKGTDCLDTLAGDTLELTGHIVELCKIVGYSDEAKARMLAAIQNLYPYQIAGERDYFKLQVIRARTGGVLG